MGTGILGGSFDPVHLGHLDLAQAARKALDLARVLLVPCAGHPFKPGGPSASAEQRLRMLDLAIRGSDGLEVSDIEIRRGGTSYTLETLEALRRARPAESEWFLILGLDNLPGLPRWRRAQELAQQVRIVCFPRRLSVSSTLVRQRIAQGGNLSGLVPAAVAEYIVRENLYATPPGVSHVPNLCP